MKEILCFLTIMTLSGYTQIKDKYNEQWKPIEIGNYIFDFPSDFKLVTGEGIDSYVGKIVGDSMSFGFDFGYYSSDFTETPQEYLTSGFWRIELPFRFMKDGKNYNEKNTPKVDVLNIRPATIQDSITGKGCNYIAKCKYKRIIFDFPIYIPEEIKQTNYVIDTTDNQYRKIVWAKDPDQGITGIYVRNINGFNESINSYLALSMAASNLTSKQQELALRIFKTVRRKRDK